MCILFGLSQEVAVDEMTAMTRFSGIFFNLKSDLPAWESGRYLHINKQFSDERRLWNLLPSSQSVGDLAETIHRQNWLEKKFTVTKWP